MQQQKQRARNAAAIETGDWITLKEGTTEFVGYDYTEYEASILRYRQIKQKNQTLYQIVLDYTRSMQKAVVRWAIPVCWSTNSRPSK